MKRQKRDKMERAFARGYQAGLTGRSKELCPYQSVDVKMQWLGGWREAIDGKITGLFNK
ncbi:ribosome modulation factor [Ferrimonas lipolytica]|uniref:Ribosome modulation factor n=1 Tax=Ferrimonas lipolytica TaxID=2724191 RepID=A0A6H1UFJ9_9GAMM|nr:ribosome modulation factor [Ferrimonas lipolytica]QIZ76572.1 ribosome modulation factor [Ferrimonas lipolytica]